MEAPIDKQHKLTNFITHISGDSNNRFYKV